MTETCGDQPGHAPGPWHYQYWYGDDLLRDRDDQFVAHFDGTTAESWPELSMLERMERDATNARLVAHMWRWLDELTATLLAGAYDTLDGGNFETLQRRARAMRAVLGLPAVAEEVQND